MHSNDKGARYRLLGGVAALALVLGVLAAGCGGDDNKSSASSAAAEVSSAVESAASQATEAASSAESQATEAVSSAEEQASSAASGAESAASGAESAASGEPVKIGILSDCEGAFGSFYESDIGGAQTALIANAGAKAKGEKPSDGLEGGTLGGHPIEIVGYGCSNDTADKAIAETRRLVEQLGAQILIGPLSGDEGIAVANYAKKEQPGVTFINGTSGAQDTTLRVQAPNFFRFNSDGAQWNAGLGDYAYNTLGWRTAAVIGDDYSFPYTSIAGFVAEFCAIGGQVTTRIWPPLGEKDYSSYVQQIPDDVDGVMVGIGGSGLIAFMKQYKQAKGEVDGKKFMGNVFWPDPQVLGEIGDLLVDGVAGGPTAGDSTEQAAVDYNNLIDTTYPSIKGQGPSVFTYNYYNAAMALISAMTEVNGDLSNNHQALNDALSKTVLDAPYGKISLDANRNAITDNYVQQIVKTDSGYGVKTILKIPATEQTFGGVFSSTTPPVDRDNPKCEKLATPPPWVGKAEKVDFSAGS